jgi:hypothetical protein
MSRDYEEVDQSATAEYVREVAKHMYQADGQVEIDDNAELSHGNDGVYVAAWVFVRYAEGGS